MAYLESFADSLDIREYSPVVSPANDHLTTTTVTTDTINTSQLLSTEHIDVTPPVVMETSPEEIIISHETGDTAMTEEVCITETTPLDETTTVQVTTSDGIQYVAYNDPSLVDNCNGIRQSPRRSTRKRQYISQEH